ncbi:MAG: hypothetical protein ACE5OT_02120, partial [Candidatus Hadarchaeaceae archaeon]
VLLTYLVISGFCCLSGEYIQSFSKFLNLTMHIPVGGILQNTIVRKKLIILYSLGLGAIIILATYLYQITHSMMDVFIVIAFSATISAFVVILVYSIVRKKLITLYSLGLGTIMTLATYLYQVKPSIVDGSIIYHGFPTYWLAEAYGWGGPPYRSSIHWGGLFLDIVFWSIIAFIIIVMIKALVKSRRS